MWFVHKGKLCKVLFTGKRVHKRTMQTIGVCVQNRLCYTGPIKSVASVYMMTIFDTFIQQGCIK